MSEIIELIKKKIKPGTCIPRPKSTDLIVKKWTKDKKGGVIYEAPSYSKTVTLCELEAAYKQLMSNGYLTRKWFEESMPHSKSKPCNFTALGGIFEVVGIAEYAKPGVYRAIN